MHIAADACIYTNHNFVIETLESTADAPGDGATAPTPAPPSPKKGKAAAAG